ncbi:MAG: class I SAM-dependent methyltransferase [Bacteroidales bacterium]|nr:class I SAM-dependent methyltransferase [Bacteroidales bacterium]
MTDNFAAKAADWDNNNPRMIMIQKFISEIESRGTINNETHLLDFGCGTGLVGLHFVDKVAELTLVDNSPAMIEVLRQKIAENGYTNTQVVEGTIEDSLKSESETLIVASMSVHHVDDIPHLINHFHKRLVKNGKVIISDLYKEDGSFHFPDVVPQNGFDMDILQSQFQAADFTVEHISNYHTMNREISTGEKRSFPLFVLVARKN